MARDERLAIQRLDAVETNNARINITALFPGDYSLVRSLADFAIRQEANMFNRLNDVHPTMPASLFATIFGRQCVDIAGQTDRNPVRYHHLY
jgi:hypothetical protein